MAKFQLVDEDASGWEKRGGRSAEPLPEPVVKAVKAAHKSGQYIKTVVSDDEAKELKNLFRRIGRAENVSVTCQLQDQEDGNVLLIARVTDRITKQRKSAAA